MLAEFHNGRDKEAHRQFQRWREANDGGFFISVRSSKSTMLHQALCPHLGKTDWQQGRYGSLTKKMKVCSRSREELLTWGREKGLTIKVCSTCKP